MKKALLGRIAAIALVAFTGVAVAVATFAWFVMPGGKTEKHIDGTIGLRGYFYAGNGSDSDPFEIVTPNHFYNLCRLQNLGIFSNRRTYFQIGHDFGGTTGLSCINSYTGSTPNYDQFLDMDTLSHTTTILPIGSESAPFIGDFNGNCIPIRNLRVQGHPEDIGVFGYVSYEGKVEGLVCDNLEICSTGYTDDVNNHSNELFSRDIDGLFAENVTGFNTASLALITTGGSGEVSLRHLNGTNGTPLIELDKNGNVIENATDGSIKSSKYTLRVNKPTAGNRGIFNYSWKASSPAVTLRSEDSNKNYFDLDINLTTLRDSQEFNSGTSGQVDCRVSIIASVDVDGYVFSRVIQSYTIEFYSNGHGYSGWLNIDRNRVRFSSNASDVDPTVGSEGDYYIIKPQNSDYSLYYRGASGWSQVVNGEATKVHSGTTLPTWAEWNNNEYNATDSYYIYSYNDASTGVSKYVLYKRDASDKFFTASIFCDYEANDAYPETDKNTKYHHGNNIGFLAGHVDGTINSSYIYNGKFSLNNEESGYEFIETESETGLVGEIGTNVVNTLDPDFGLTKNGEIGIMNFSRIYGLIRDEAKDNNGNNIVMQPGDTIYAGQANSRNYVSYDNYLSPSYVRYAQYLRKYPGVEKGYITGTSRNMKGTYPNDDWDQRTIPDPVPTDFNSVDFAPNQIIEDEKNSLYVDMSSLDLYQKIDYVWGDPLTEHVISSSYAPATNVGSTGDYRFNAATTTLFKKESNSWGNPIPTKRGDSVPTYEGKTNEYYLLIDATPVLYQYDGSEWTIVTSTFGPSLPNSGSVGDKFIYTANNYYDLYIMSSTCWTKKSALYGETAPLDTIGSGDDLYVNYINGKMYRKPDDNNAWELLGTIPIDNIAPGASDGENGDYCIDTISFSVFTKSNGEWTRFDNATYGRGMVDKSTNNSGDRGLGVFKIVSDYDTAEKTYRNSNPMQYFTADMGKCIIQKGKSYNKVYFSTAELDHRAQTNPSFSGFRGTELPSYYDLDSFKWPFGRDYDYLFELDLSDINQGTGYYMHNTDSGFLTHYLYNILIDKNGARIQPTDDRFGFMFSSADDKSVTPVSSLYSYMPVGDPLPSNGSNTKTNFGTSSNPRWYPENSIVFHIDNPHGANVSVVGRGQNSSTNITIYSNNPTKKDIIEPLYTMKACADDRYDKHRFFSYDYKTGETGTEAVAYGDLYIKTGATENDYELYKNVDETWSLIESGVSKGAGIPSNTNEGEHTYYIDTKANNLYKWETNKWVKQYGVLNGTSVPDTLAPDMMDTSCLYGHIFKLPAGDYVLGGDNGTANIYYLAVQGQTEGNVGDNEMAGIGNAITDVDFLTSRPIYSTIDRNWEYASFSFKANFNKVSGEFIVGIDTDDGNKFRIFFSDYQTPFVTYLLTYSRTTTLTYYIKVQTGVITYSTNEYGGIIGQSVTFRTP